ncbi:platelet-activating factor acetylhydrolase plasma/intracellular [Mollisia scopiformis]|uniref:Platelet-activating factor acetylhydrolase plasma/intracellular n=1 Tax=Mollisia scopiformis TaxID=149040 RepID=A0A194X130_MOLSC|nr:platelet-activating factor acetylhydrolase plasma/intracellular [Mollisia scopiformis]KUJ13572.1 platelet-activating factor acetylhydrolase plasma/intracellular [Mollisia scopiformis]
MVTKSTEAASRTPQDHALIGEAKNIPINSSAPVVSVSPITLPAPGCLLDLQLRISFPITGNNLPIILLSHGHGQSNNLSSSNGYGPLASFWAAHGFVVIQPTHLSSKSLSLDPATPGAPLFWRSRVEDMKLIIDQLEQIEASTPNLKGRLDQTRIAVAGHSLGGHTAGMLLGARLKDPENGEIVDLIEPRIKAGILLAAPGDGNGGADLSEFARGNPAFALFRDPSFAKMTTPTLVVVGDADISPHLTVRGADWHADPYTLSPGPKSLLTLVGGEHGLGGISGYDAGETTDESVERAAVVQRLTWAYLRSQLYAEDKAWSDACVALEGLGGLGKVESK